MDNVIVMADESTWPSDIVNYLTENHDVFFSWEARRNNQYGVQCDVRSYDRVSGQLRELLNQYLLHGYHCTRLTENEIDVIRANGMSLPNGEFLKKRIQALITDQLISTQIAEQLIKRNQADEKYRANQIWFCFYDPYLADQDGIERFFRSWGGEALYNSHESDPETGIILNAIGIPCIIEAVVPISGIGHSFLDDKIARRYLINRGFNTQESTEHDDDINIPLPVENVLNIFRFPEQRFIDLTRCDTWRPSL